MPRRGCFAEAVVTGSPEPIYAIDPAQDFRAVFVNDATCRHFGYSREQLLQMSPADWDPDFPLSRLRERWKARTGGSHMFETWHRRADGGLVPVEVCHSILFYEGRELSVGHIREITERKRVQVALEHSRSLLLATLESTADGILVVDREGRIASYNTQFAQMWSLPSDVLDAGDDSRALEHVLDQVEDADTFLSQVRQLYKRPDAESFDLLTFKDGRVYERYSRPQLIQGRPVGRVWSFRDVTLRHRAEEALRLRVAALDAAANAIVITDRAGTIQWVNRGWTTLTGYSAGEAVGQNPRLLKSGGQDAAFYGALWTTILSGRVWHAELVNRRRDGTLYVEEETITPLLENGEVTNFIAIKQDISERRRVEEALRESEDRYRDLVEHSADLICTHDLEGRLLSVNPRAAEILGYSPEKLLQIPMADLLVPEMRDRFPEYLERIGRDGVASGVMRLQTASGGVRTWEYHNTVRSEGVAAPIVRGMAHDVTERQKAQEALHDSEERLRLALQAADQGMFDLDVVTGDAKVSPEYATMLGYDPEEFQESNAAWIERLHPDDVERVSAVYRDYIAGAIPEYRVEFRQRTRSGEWKWILSHGRVVERDSGGRPRRMLGTHTDITDRKQAELALSQEASRRRILFEGATDGIAVIDASGRVMEANPSFARLLGYTADEVLSLHAWDWDAEHATGVAVSAEWSALPSTPATVERKMRRKDGWVFDAEVSATPTVWAGEKLLFLICRDITERKRAEEERTRLQAQLVQAQKMESVGRLAGGVAHDFNNMLSVILGHSELALETLSPEDPLHAALSEIRQAAARSSDLTRQLLALSRRQTVAPQVLDLNDHVSAALKMLRRLIGEDIHLAWVPGPALWPVKVDPSQVDQILLNLCVNARDAIESGGRITIETTNIVLSEESCRARAGAPAGSYVLLSVDDNGCGMSPNVLEHLFEPFYTTKEMGRGTGLGLATVYGIVKQNNGFVDVESEPRCGTTFHVYLPRTGTAAVVDRMATAALPPGAGKTLLLVEDEGAILQLARAMLQGLGYTVLAADTPGDALRQAALYPRAIDLVITDVVMPEMNGRELATQLAAIRPGIRCLFMSGYTADVIADRGVLNEGVQYLQKPFSRRDLALKVRDALGTA